MTFDELYAMYMDPRQLTGPDALGDPIYSATGEGGGYYISGYQSAPSRDAYFNLDAQGNYTKDPGARNVFYDSSTGQFRVSQGDMDSGGIQRWEVDRNGVRDAGFESPRSFGDHLRNAANNAAPYLAGMAGLGIGAAYLPALLGGGGAAAGSAGAAAGGAATGAGGGLGGATFGAGLAEMPTFLGTGSGLLGPGGAGMAGVGGLDATAILNGAGGWASGAGGLAGIGAGSTLGSLASYLPYGAAAVSGIAGANASREAGQVQADAANRAAEATLQATRESNQLLRDMYDTSRADNQPWMDAGKTALSSLTAGTAPGGEFTQRFDASRMYDDPGYAFRLSEGNKAIDRASASAGRFDSGRSLRELTRYGQDYASGEYGAAYGRFDNDQTNRFNRLSSLAGTGQTAVRDNNSAGMNTASQVGQNTIAGANNAGNMRTSGAAARASGYVGGTNAITNAVGQGLGYMQNSRLMDMLARRG